MTGCKIIRSSYTGKNPVDNTNVRGGCRNIASNLRHENNQRRLPHIGRLTCHIRSGDDGDAVAAVVKIGIIIDKQVIVNHFFDNRMSSILDINRTGFVDFRPAVIVLLCNECQGYKYIQPGDCFGRL